MTTEAVNVTQEQLQEMMQNAVTAAMNALHTTNDGRAKVKHADRLEIDLGINENQCFFSMPSGNPIKDGRKLQTNSVVMNYGRAVQKS